MATLGFSTKWPKHMGGGDTHFVEKIWKGLIDNKIADNDNLVMQRFMAMGNKHKLLPLANNYHVHKFTPKLHTIRRDEKNLWKPGRKIHPVVFNRTINRFQFAPVLECKAVQNIEIKYHNFSYYPHVKVDGSRYDVWEKAGIEFINQLALNDGFDSVEHFLKWFNEDTKPNTVLIHWTDLKY